MTGESTKVLNMCQKYMTYSQVKLPRRKNNINIKWMALRNVMWGRCQQKHCWSKQEAENKTFKTGRELRFSLLDKNYEWGHDYLKRMVSEIEDHEIVTSKLINLNRLSIKIFPECVCFWRQCGGKDIYMWYWWLCKLIQYF